MFSLYIHNACMHKSPVDRVWTCMRKTPPPFSGFVAVFFEKFEPETTRLSASVRATVPRCPRLLRNSQSSMAMLDASRTLMTLGPASFALRKNFEDLKVTLDPKPMTIGAPVLFNLHSSIIMSEMSTVVLLHT